MPALPLRLFGIVFALVGVYLTYISAHQAPIVLACYGGGAVLAILSMIMLWHKPAIASPLAAIFVIAGIIAQMIVVPKTSTATALNAQMSSPVPASSAEAAAPTPPSSNVAFNAIAQPTPSGMPSLQPASGALSAPQAVPFDYSDFMGHGDIDDGIAGVSYSQQTTHAVSQVVAVFGNGAQPTPTPVVTEDAQKLLDADQHLPASEYSLGALAQTLPDDPVALYRFVRDNIATDPYNGIMRGPIGTWLSRAGSADDKIALLGYLLVKKHVPLQFVRGTLSSAEETQVAQSANKTSPATPLPAPSDAAAASQAEAVLDKYVRDGSAFARWSMGQLSSSNITTGAGSVPQISAQHYWIQIDRGGKVFDLDPTLPAMNEGQHLGSIDPSFKPWAMLPNEAFHWARIMLTAKYQDGTNTVITQAIAKTCDLAYVPIRIAIAPPGDFLSTVGSARTFNVGIVGGSRNLALQGTLDLDAHQGLRQLTLQIDRKDTDGHTFTSIRNFLPPSLSRAAQGPAISGLTSLIVVPGSGANAFTVHTALRSYSALVNSVELAKNGRMTPVSVYPMPLADFFIRDEGVASKLLEETSGRFYRNRPNIVMERIWLKPGPKGLRAVLGFDIVDNSMSVTGVDSAKATASNLARGYADTTIENDVIHGDPSYGALAVFDSARKSGVQTVVVAAHAAPPAVGALGDGLDVSLASGNVAIAPATTVSVANRKAFGWWDIDASTGNAVGRTTGGVGPAGVEYGTILQLISSTLQAYEVVQLAKECGESAAACGGAVCSATIGAGFFYHAMKHAHVGGFAFVAWAVVEVGAFTAAKFGLCAVHEGGGEGGGGGGGGNGGQPPPDNGPPYCQEPNMCQ